MKRVTPRMARIRIIEIAPDPDRLLQQLRDDPASLPRFVQSYVKRAARRIEQTKIKKRPFDEANEKSRRRAAAQKKLIRKRAEEVAKANPALARSANQLAIKINKCWPELGSIRNIRRDLPPKK